MVSSENFFIIYSFFTILFEKFAGYVIISLEMPTFIQLFYCPNCKKNVSTENAKKSKRCGTLAKKKGWPVRFRVQASGQNVHKRLSGFKTKKDANRAYIEYLFASKYQKFCKKNRKIQSMENRKRSGKKLSFWRRQTSCRKHHKKKIVSRYCKKWTANNLATRLSAFLCQPTYSFGRSNQSDRGTYWRPRKTGDRNL